MSVEVKGVETLINQLERKFGREKMREVEDDALNAGGEFFKSTLQKNFKSFEDTGASIQEMTKTDPFYSKNARKARSILIKWEGSMDRFKLIHLNEHGYTRDGKKIVPRGFGVIAKTLKSSELAYRQIIINVLRARI
ncbi:hypothetical protein [Staphylococcus xylosus]|uniref:hypothetical protein n=1 Tax=Staphylococcus xylosus TaxID=1288 RepID=UPI002DBEF883|nr:hypothetical protein [Staphylococcus xylosus]MEB8101052.1 hypothetical protein [Staphylococcus xylosus]